LIVAVVAICHWDSWLALLFIVDPIQWAMLGTALLLVRASMRSVQLMQAGAEPNTVSEPFLRFGARRVAWVGLVCFTLIYGVWLTLETYQSLPATMSTIRQSIQNGQLFAGPQLPACDSPEVINLVDSLVHKSITGAEIQSIDGHHQISYDNTTEQRVGRCVARITSAKIPLNVTYTVTWLERDKRRFSVTVRLGEQ
jgi:hypothetical protein